jgi:predicted neutral ceramidase superfamily lipid hydrolase
MTGTYMRHVALLVVLAALLVPHWLPASQPPATQPLVFAAGLLLGVALAIVWGVSAGRPAKGPLAPPPDRRG